MQKNLITVLIIGDAPKFIVYSMVCRFLGEGYKVKTLNSFLYGDDIKGIALRSKNLLEVEYNIRDENSIREAVADCYAVIYLSDSSFKAASNVEELMDHGSLTLLMDISKNCGVRQFIYGSIPVLKRSKGDDEDAGRIQIEGLQEYLLKYNELLNDNLEKTASSRFIITHMYPYFSPKYFFNNSFGLNIFIKSNFNIYKSKIKILSKNRNKLHASTNFRLINNEEQFEGDVLEFHLKSIFDLCILCLEYAEKANERKWFRILFKRILSQFYFSRYIVDFVRNPRIPGRIILVFRSIKRFFDVSMMMFLFNLRPEQIYRFSTRKLLPKKSERVNLKNRPTIPFELIETKTSEIERMKEINIVMKGSSFDISKIGSLKGPTFLVNFENYDGSLELAQNIIFVSGKMGSTYRLTKLGKLVYQIEVNKMDENGKTYPPESYTDLKWYNELFHYSNFKRIAIAERICAPYKLPLTPSWRPTGAGLNTLCGLYYFADKINIYGWDFYFESSPNDMTYWEIFSRLNNYKLDVFRSSLHFECAIINFYYGYHLSKLPNINNFGYMGQLGKHEKLLRKIERVLFK